MSYELMEKQVVFEGKKVRVELHHLRDEQSGRQTTREVCVHNGAVVILPLLGDERVLLITNRRYPIGQTLIELPAGTLEKSEDPLDCAGRELLEETGYSAGRVGPLGSFYTSPGILSEKIHAFVAYDLEKKRQALEEGEEIELLPVKLELAIEMIQDGRIADGKTIAALLMYDRFRRG